MISSHTMCLHGEVLLISTRNICFHGEMLLTSPTTYDFMIPTPLLSGAMNTLLSSVLSN